MAEAKPHTNLYGKTLSELEATMAAVGQKPFRAKQLFEWIYKRRVTQFDAMTNLSKDLRTQLAANYQIQPPGHFEKRISSDGSEKYIFHVGSNQAVEAVYMPMTKGITMCLSSQVGCAQACSFCMTAQMGFIRNLTPGEIVGQALTMAQDHQLENPFNLVMMGMGEPLLNYNNLIKAIDILTHDLGVGLSPKRITISTSGHVGNLLKLKTLARLPRIAISLNATTDQQRDHLMPVNQRWNIEELINACSQLPLGPRDRITFEYVLMKDINDSLADAKRLIRLVANIKCKVNLIPFNATQGLPYQQPELAQIEAFKATLDKSSILNTIRWSKGRDVGAACGQLATPVKKPGSHIPRQQPTPTQENKNAAQS